MKDKITLLLKGKIPDDSKYSSKFILPRGAGSALEEHSKGTESQHKEVNAEAAQDGDAR